MYNPKRPLCFAQLLVSSIAETNNSSYHEEFFSGVKGIDFAHEGRRHIWTEESVIDSMTHPINDQSIYRGRLPLQVRHTNADIFPVSIFETISIPSHHLPGLTLIVHKRFFLVGAAWDETVVHFLAVSYHSIVCVVCIMGNHLLLLMGVC